MTAFIQTPTPAVKQQQKDVERTGLDGRYKKAPSESHEFSGASIDSVYTAKNKAMIETQLVKAGLRLSGLLNKMFGG